MSNVSSSNSQAELVPKLRFPEFQGEWSKSELGSIGSFCKGAALSKADISDNGTPFILYGELYTTYNEVTYTVHRRTKCSVDNECYSKVGDVIIPTSGETPEEIATSTCVMIPNVILAGDLNIYRNTKIDGRFLSYIINHIVNNEIARTAQGKSIVHIKANELAKISVRYPSSLEQSKILSLFELLDKRIDKQKAYIEILKSYKRGLLSTIIKRYSIGRKLSEIADYRSSANTLSMIEEKNQGLYPVYDANGICGYSHTCDITTNYIAIIKDGSGVGRLQSCKGMSSTIGTLGAIIPVNCSAEYLYAALSLVDFKPFITGMAIPHIYFKDYRKIEIPFPNGKIRSDIATLSTLFDEHILASINVMNELTKQKHSLFQELFI